MMKKRGCQSGIESKEGKAVWVRVHWSVDLTMGNPAIKAFQSTLKALRGLHSPLDAVTFIYATGIPSIEPMTISMLRAGSGFKN